MYYIYLIQNKINNKIYIGQTINTKERFRQHIKNAFKPNKYRFNLAISKAIKKYGVENFSFQTIDQATSIEEINELEIFYISYFRFLNNSINVYNIANGGDNKEVSYETRVKMGNSRRGRKHSEESKLLISKVHKGRTLSLEHKQKLSVAGKGNTNSLGVKCPDHVKEIVSKTHRGRKRSLETRKRLSECKKGKNNPNYGKKLSPETLRKREETKRKNRLLTSKI